MKHELEFETIHPPEQLANADWPIGDHRSSLPLLLSSFRFFDQIVVELRHGPIQDVEFVFQCLEGVSERSK